MTIELNADLVKEWQALHSSHEHYEHFALLIKLVAIVLTISLLIFDQSIIVTLLMLAILWLQEGIWKTYQARTSNRIALIEQALINTKRDNKNLVVDFNTSAFQFYHQWRDSRSGAITLIKEYLKNSVKPTVVYPYVPLMLLALIAKF